MQRTTNPHLTPPPQAEGEEDAKRLVRELHLLVLTLSFVLVAQLVSCETTTYVPPVTPQMAAGSSQRKDVNLIKLRQGRTLFVHRCIECHTLPPVWKYSREDWPQIVNDMSHRASLKPAESEAVIAYILAARPTER